MYARMAGALEARAARPAEPNASMLRKACLYVVPRGVAVDSLSDGVLPAGIVSAQEHCLTSDVTRARLTGATSLPADRLVADRAEGRFARLRTFRWCLVRCFKGAADVIHESGERRTDHGRPSQRHRRDASGMSRASRRDQYVVSAFRRTVVKVRLKPDTTYAAKRKRALRSENTNTRSGDQENSFQGQISPDLLISCLYLQAALRRHLARRPIRAASRRTVASAFRRTVVKVRAKARTVTALRRSKNGLYGQRIHRRGIRRKSAELLSRDTALGAARFPVRISRPRCDVISRGRPIRAVSHKYVVSAFRRTVVKVRLKPDTT